MTRASRAHSIGSALLALGMGILVAGCGKGPTGNQDMSTKVGWSDITSDLNSRGCLLAVSCHGANSTANTVWKSIASSGDMAGYTATVGAASMVMPADKIVAPNDPAHSEILSYPMTSTHSGGQIFTSTSDATYVKLMGWINKGAPFAAQ